MANNGIPRVSFISNADSTQAYQSIFLYISLTGLVVTVHFSFFCLANDGIPRVSFVSYSEDQACLYVFLLFLFFFIMVFLQTGLAVTVRLSFLVGQGCLWKDSLFHAHTHNSQLTKTEKKETRSSLCFWPRMAYPGFILFHMLNQIRPVFLFSFFFLLIFPSDFSFLFIMFLTDRPGSDHSRP